MECTKHTQLHSTLTVEHKLHDHENRLHTRREGQQPGDVCVVEVPHDTCLFHKLESVTV